MRISTKSYCILCIKIKKFKGIPYILKGFVIYHGKVSNIGTHTQQKQEPTMNKKKLEIQNKLHLWNEKKRTKFMKNYWIQSFKKPEKNFELTTDQDSVSKNLKCLRWTQMRTRGWKLANVKKIFQVKFQSFCSEIIKDLEWGKHKFFL